MGSSQNMMSGWKADGQDAAHCITFNIYKEDAMRITATITEKGQVTIPKVVRDTIDSRVIEFILEDGIIQVKSVPNVGGSLSGYAERYVPLEEVREAVWGTHASE